MKFIFRLITKVTLSPTVLRLISSATNPRINNSTFDVLKSSTASFSEICFPSKALFRIFETIGSTDFKISFNNDSKEKEQCIASCFKTYPLLPILHHQLVM